jgi:CNT family concentrative nucleoside transporter
MGRYTGFLGLIVILAFAWLCSSHKRDIKLSILAWGLGLQFAFAILVLKTDFGKIFQAIGVGVNNMLGYVKAGTVFMFGPLGDPNGPYAVIFAFQVLPIIIFIASFFAILYYLGVMQWIVKGMAIVMQKVMGVSGAESLNVAASIFMGQTEAPLTIKPFLAGLTESELFTIMTSGMAHVSGSVMAAYVMVANVSITHLLTAVIMTAPATIMLSKIIIPEIGKPATAGKVEIKVEKTAVNVIDAAAQGAGDGLHLALNVGGMLIAFLALIAMLNGILGWVHTMPLMGWLPGSLEQIFGVVFAPVAWIMGVPWKDASTIGNLLGTRLVTNEFVAFLELGKPAVRAALDPRSFVIATYALCGFANFSSIAIQIGGIGSLAPNRKSDLARLGIRAVMAGTMANFMSACIAGMLL